MIMGHCWNNREGENPVSVSLCPPQISHGLTVGSNPGLRGYRPVSNLLSHGKAPENVHGYLLCLGPNLIWTSHKHHIISQVTRFDTSVDTVLSGRWFRHSASFFEADMSHIGRAAEVQVLCIS
jgi:hypothetical protein